MKLMHIDDVRIYVLLRFMQPYLTLKSFAATMINTRTCRANIVVISAVLYEKELK